MEEVQEPQELWVLIAIAVPEDHRTNNVRYSIIQEPSGVERRSWEGEPDGVFLWWLGLLTYFHYKCLPAPPPAF